ncbi:MAG: sigma-70 family RNA polymerase sigma factor [Planctomycetota bacterium]|jgi:RNA polymerase sigma-70 factor (ECF subfamily)
MNHSTDETRELLQRAGQGDAQALDELFARHRDRLVRMVRLRLDRRLQGRIDASDVLQETHLEAWRRLADYLHEKDPMPFFLWLRFLAGQKVLELHRRHLGAQRRDARQEVRLHYGPLPEVTSVALAEQLMGYQTGPSKAAARAEMRARLQEALNTMDPADREILSLRHFEQLTHGEAARELGLNEAATRQRYIRALKRFKAVLADLPGGPWEISS